ncbi:MAG: APC family permease [Anaerolineaceae bacterium]|nr:APC family permease [Anaerolineaceae bacterium]
METQISKGQVIAETPVKRKKVTLLLTVATGIGAIVGAGMFTTTPIAVKIVGPAVIWVFLLTALYVILRMVPMLTMTSALPANGGEYMHASRMLPAPAGILLILKILMHGTMNISVLSLTLAQYLQLLIPSINLTIAAIIGVLFFAIIATFGARNSGIVQLLFVVILFVALGVFIFGGLPFVNPENITLEKLFAPTLQLAMVWACMGLLNGTLMGGHTVIAFAEEVENPGKVIPLGFLISTLLTAVLYAVFAYVAVGVAGAENIFPGPGGSIGDVAGRFLSPSLLTFFIIGGALVAILTDSSLLMYGFQCAAAGRDRILPKAMTRMNKYHSPYVGIWFYAVVAIIAILSGLSLERILLVGTCATMFIGQIGIFPLFVVKKYYPLSFKNCFMNKIPYWLNLVFAVATTYLSFEFGVSLAKRLDTAQWIIMAVFIGGGFIAIMLRALWLKQKGVDMYAEIRKPYAPWEAREKALKAE